MRLILLVQTSLVDGCEIVQRMLELLSQEDDTTCHEWASVIVEDLVDHAKELFNNEASKELLLLAIQIPADPDPVPIRLQVNIASKQLKVVLRAQSWL